MREAKIYPVSVINLYVKRILSVDPILSDVMISGEISNFKRHSSGHLYFTLKDAAGAIDAVMFASDARGLRFFPVNGDEVVVRGSVSLYEKTGKYQVYVRSMKKSGSGDLYLAFEQLKQKLEREGLFDPGHKKPIPAFPRKIGIVTSPTGAAIEDIMQISRRRFPGVRLVLYPARVQGEGAAATIVQGIRRLDRIPDVDTIIVARGGGSIEDLWAFNEEITARAIFACRTPVISGVGHETDFTIADFVSDLRAPTPSAAAELSVPAVNEILLKGEGQTLRQHDFLIRYLQTQRSRLSMLERALRLSSPRQKLMDRRLDADRYMQRMQQILRQHLNDHLHQLDKLSQRLEMSSPLHQLERGYAYISDENGKTLNRTGSLSVGDRIRVTMSDGSLETRIERINKADGSAEK